MTLALVNSTKIPGEPPQGVTTTIVTTHREFNTTTVAVLTGLLVFLGVLLILIATRMIRDRTIRRLITFIRRRPRRLTGTKLQERIDRRYETIEHWLITKRALSHDDFCTRVLNEIIPLSPPACQYDANLEKDLEAGRLPTPAVVASNACSCPADSLKKPAAATDDLQDDDDEPECPICMNTLRVDETVSWSANAKCGHVYHHECIKEWLLRHTGCPFCRETFLPCDEVRGQAKTDALKEMSKRYSSRSSTSYYCIQDGLVALPPLVRCTLKELETLKTRIFDSSFQPDQLVELRGERQEGTCTSLAKDGMDLECGIEEASENPSPGDDLLVVYTPDDPVRMIRVCPSQRRNRQAQTDSLADATENSTTSNNGLVDKTEEEATETTKEADEENALAVVENVETAKVDKDADKDEQATTTVKDEQATATDKEIVVTNNATQEKETMTEP